MAGLRGGRVLCTHDYKQAACRFYLFMQVHAFIPRRLSSRASVITVWLRILPPRFSTKAAALSHFAEQTSGLEQEVMRSREREATRQAYTSGVGGVIASHCARLPQH